MGGVPAPAQQALHVLEVVGGVGGERGPAAAQVAPVGHEEGAPPAARPLAHLPLHLLPDQGVSCGPAPRTRAHPPPGEDEAGGGLGGAAGLADPGPGSLGLELELQTKVHTKIRNHGE